MHREKGRISLCPVKTTPSLFTIRLSGEGVRPHLIPAGDLAQLLIAAEQSVLGLAARENPGEADSLVVGLAAVRDESIGFAFTSNRPESALAAYRELVTLTENRAFRSLPARSLEGLKTLTNFSREHRGVTQFWNGTTAKPLLELPSDFAIEVPSPEYQRGETVIYGKIERVGGVRPRVRLRISEREVISADINEEQSRELGSRMYSHAALRGQATWDAQDGSIVYFRVEEVLHYQPSKVSAAFDELRAVVNGAYDRVDVEDHALKVREGELP